jgi:hypothetical protein
VIADRQQFLEALVPGSRWRHRNGNLYEVITLANTESTRSDYVPTVVYRGTNGKTWSRTVSSWPRSFTVVDQVPEVQVTKARLPVADHVFVLTTSGVTGL